VRGVQLDQVLGEVVRGADRAEGVDSGDVGDDLASRHYVDVLLPALLSRVDDGDLRDQLREALAGTVDRLGLAPGAAPSSTVLILRVGKKRVEVAALGDSTAVIGHPDGTTSRLSDDRLSRIGADQRRAYREHLRQGSGFGPDHRGRLRELQRSEFPHRNRPGGYRIAEADPGAADELVIRAFPRDEVSWVVLATDGAQTHIDRLGGRWDLRGQPLTCVAT
jgi:hypothetical protein